MKYKFEQFKVEIEPTSIEVDLNTIRDRAIDKQLSVDVVLICEGGKFGVTAENMVYDDSWEDADVINLVNEWLTNYVVVE